MDGAAAVDAPERAHRGLENAQNAFPTPPTAVLVLRGDNNEERLALAREQGVRRYSGHLPRGRFSDVPQWPHLNVR